MAFALGLNLCTEECPDQDYFLKVQFGDTIRRLKYAHNVESEYDLYNTSPLISLWFPPLSLNSLTERIRELFELPTTGRLLLSFVDEDNDIVTLSHDDDVKERFEKLLQRGRLRVEANMVRDGDGELLRQGRELDVVHHIPVDQTVTDLDLDLGRVVI